MLFKRRKPAGWIETFRISLWPRHSWARSWRYISKRVVRLRATPHTIALGVCAGTLASFSPFIGLHFVLAFIIAWIMRANIIAAALGTFVGNPITFPFIWFATYELGVHLLNVPSIGEGPITIAAEMAKIIGLTVSFQWIQAAQIFNHLWMPIIYPMLIGGLILGTVSAAFLYFPVKEACNAFQQKRRDIILLRKKIKIKMEKVKKQKLKTKKIKIKKVTRQIAK